MLPTPVLRSAKPQQDKPKGWKCDCPSIFTGISVIRSIGGGALFHATSFLKKDHQLRRLNFRQWPVATSQVLNVIIHLMS